jgi:hypothetical protein
MPAVMPQIVPELMPAPVLRLYLLPQLSRVRLGLCEADLRGFQVGFKLVLGHFEPVSPITLCCEV